MEKINTDFGLNFSRCASPDPPVVVLFRQGYDERLVQKKLRYFSMICQSQFIGIVV